MLKKISLLLGCLIGIPMLGAQGDVGAQLAAIGPQMDAVSAGLSPQKPRRQQGPTNSQKNRSQVSQSPTLATMAYEGKLQEIINLLSTKNGSTKELVNTPNRKGRTPLYSALKGALNDNQGRLQEYINIIALFLEKGAVKDISLSQLLDQAQNQSIVNDLRTALSQSPGNLNNIVSQQSKVLDDVQASSVPQSEANDAEAKYKALEAEKRELEETLATLQNSSKATEKALQSQLKTAQDEYANLEEQKKNLETTSDLEQKAFTTKKEELEKQITTLQEKLQTNTTEYQNELKMVQAQSDDLQTVYQNVKATSATLQAAQEKLKTDALNAITDNKQLKEKQTNLESSLSSLMTQRNALLALTFIGALFGGKHYYDQHRVSQQAEQASPAA